MEVAPMHGYLCNTFDWPNPIRVVTCEKEARPGYAVVPAHEYNEANEEVLLVCSFFVQFPLCLDLMEFFQPYPIIRTK